MSTGGPRDLSTLAGAARDRPVLVVVLVLSGAMLLAGVALLVPPTYTAQASLLVAGDPGPPSDPGAAVLTFPLDRMSSYTELVTTPSVLEPVSRRQPAPGATGDLAALVRGSTDPGTVVLDVQARGRTAEDAPALANAVAAQTGTVIEGLETPQPGAPSRAPVALTAPAVPPAGRVWPSVTMATGTGLIAGLILGVGLAGWRARSTRRGGPGSGTPSPAPAGDPRGSP